MREKETEADIQSNKKERGFYSRVVSMEKIAALMNQESLIISEEDYSSIHVRSYGMKSRGIQATANNTR